MSIEELECRAQPALFGVAASLHALGGFEHAFGAPVVVRESVLVSTSARGSLPAQANAHAQVEFVLHFHVGNPPTEPPGGGSGGNAGGGTAANSGGGNTGGGGVTNPPSGAAEPPASNPTTTPAVFSSSTAGESFTFVFVRSPAAQPAPAGTASLASANSALLLPPGANATTALAPASVAALPAVPAPAGTPGAASISSPAPPLVDGAFADSADENVPPGTPANVAPGAKPVQGPPRPDAAPMPAEKALPVAPPPRPVVDAGAFLAPVVDANAAAPALEEAVPVAAPIIVEEGGAPWAWAVGVIGAAAAGSWAVRRFWLKPAPEKRPDERSWRTYLLGADFDRQ